MYESLAKLYYQGEKAYEEAYQLRRNAPSTIVINFDIKGNEAFFVHSPEVISLGMEIHKIDKRIAVLRKGLPLVAINQFCLKCLVDEIVQTNQIEGVYTTKKEIGQILEKLQEDRKRKPGRDRFDGLVTQYLKLKACQSIPLDTCQDVRDLYDVLVLPDVLKEEPSNRPDGQIFRKECASVFSKTQQEIHRGLYPEALIQNAMEKALGFLKRTDVQPLYQICVFHYLIEYIHPFYDGNGRLGRFIVSYLLSQELDPLIAYRLSYTIMENINEYYAAFKVCNDPKNKGDVTPFLLMMLRMVKVSMENLKDALEERVYQLNKYEELIEDLPGSEKAIMKELYYYLLQARLFSGEGIPLADLIELLEKGATTVRSYLRDVEKNGFLLEKRYGRKLGYALNLKAVDAYTNTKE